MVKKPNFSGLPNQQIERQTNLPLKPRTTRTLSRLTRTNSRLTRTNSKLTHTNSNLTRTNSKPNPIQVLCNHNKGQKEQQKLRTTNNPIKGVTLIKTHFNENIPALGSMHYPE